MVPVVECPAVDDPVTYAPPDSSAATHLPVGRRVCYVLNHCFPFASNGYAVRSHGIASALARQGFSVVALGRPGHPWDLPGFPTDGGSSFHRADGVNYLFTRLPRFGPANREQWQAIATRELIDHFETLRPEAVIAASNWENALPAMRASRTVGLPFFYEVRGFWELSELSSDPGYLSSPQYLTAMEKELEAALGAQRVFTLNAVMRDELVRRGVPAAKIDIVPNALVHLPPLARRSDPRAGRSAEGFRLGYIGSFSPYEGLDDLVAAVHGLRADGWNVKLRLVGSSHGAGMTDSKLPCAATQALRDQAVSLGIDPHVEFAGRVAPSQVGAFYDDLDLFVLPRKPWPVCEIVQPLKPLEAAAYGCPVLASDVAPHLEMAPLAGFALFRKGDVGSLQARIAALLGDAGKRDRMSRQARAWIERDCLFDKTITPLSRALAGAARETPIELAGTARQPSQASEPNEIGRAIERVHRYGLARFHVIRHDGGRLECRDILQGEPRSVSEQALRDLQPTDRAVELVRRGFVPAAMGAALRPIAQRPTDRDDPHFWQFPARTEAAAWELHLPIEHASRQDGAIHAYLGLPWATWIDKEARSGVELAAIRREMRMQQVRLEGVRRLVGRMGVPLRVHTVCQHVKWRALLPRWHEIGITDIWLSHAPTATGGPGQGAPTVHPWAVHAVNVETPSRNLGLTVGADPSQKKLLASFVGAHADHYISDARLRLQAIADAPGFHVRVTREWHFENEVYRHQIDGHPLQPDAAQMEAVRAYNAVLSDSRFSLCPAGAGPNTIRLWESLATGAVPVLLGPAPRLPQGGTLPPIDWDEIVIRVADEQIPDLPRILRSVSLEEVRRRQQLGMQAYMQVRSQRCF